MRNHIQSLIGKEYNTITAGNGMDALHKIQESMPSLVLSDIMMPVMDGMQLLKEIRQNPATAHIPVILITARAGEESRIEGYEIGADDYLVKPFSANELMARIKAQIRVTLVRNKIRDSERQFRNVLEQSPSIFLILTGPEMRISFVNEPLLRSWGRQKDIVGKTILEVLPELKDQPFPKLLQVVYETGEMHQGKEEKAVLMKDGVPVDVYYEYVYQPIFEDDKHVTGITIMATDITEQVVARKKIEESERKLRTLTETLPQLVWMTDAKGRQQFVSGRWFEYSGIEPSGEDTWAAMVHADDMQKIVKAWTGALDTGNPYSVEVRLKNKAGEYRWHFGQGEPIKNEKDEIVNWMGSFTDIHNQRVFAENLEIQVQKRTAELIEKNIALENSESFLQQILDSSVEFISVLDRDLKYITVNKRYEDVFKKYRDDLFGRHVVEVHPGLSGTLLYDAILKALHGETVYMAKQRSITRPDFFVDTYFLPLTIQNKIEGVIIMARDVTDIVHSEAVLEEKNRDLERINKELESFTYVASHDLQEPLRKIQTFIDLISTNADDKEAVKKYYRKIDASAQRMSELIRSVLAFSTISKEGEEFSSTDLNKILEAVKNDYELRIEEKKAVIKSDRLPVIIANPLQMNQLFSNLVSNSLKFSKEKPEIKISARSVKGIDIPAEHKADPKQDFVQLTFADNGIGFDRAFKEKIFNLFQRLHGKHEYSGTGIGLSIVKKIVELHKGFIAAESKPGEGSVFSIWLPA
jgi:PAS domain S-box-containing protein